MADWDTAGIKIGSKTRGGGNAQRETVVRGNAALNAAKRSGGAISTEKKFAGGNPGLTAGGSDGQRMAKIDRSDDIVKPKTVGKDIGKVIAQARNAKGWTQSELAKQAQKPPKVIQEWENGTAQPDQATKNAIENKLNVKLTPGPNLGQPKFGAKKKKEEGK